MTIDLQLVQDTVNYLETCPHGEVKDLVQRWIDTVNPKLDVKPEKEPDAG
jgi:hypothetical protein